MGTRPAIFKWRQTEPGLILCAVRWYLRYSLSLRDVEELLEERGLNVDHTTVWCWRLRLGRGRRPAVAPGFDASHLHALLAVVESASCSGCQACTRWTGHGLRYWQKLKHVAEKVTDTEVRLVLPHQQTPQNRRFNIEGVVDILRDEGRTIMYDIKTHDVDYVRENRLFI
jgi:hypothetical protein